MKKTALVIKDENIISYYGCRDRFQIWWRN